MPCDGEQLPTAPEGSLTITMFLKPRTLRGQLSLMIAFMGGIGLLCSIFIVNNYTKRIEENQRQATQDLIKQETITLTEAHRKSLVEFGLRIQKQKVFRKAFRNNNIEQIQVLLNDEFHQYFVTAKVLVINKIYAFDLDYHPLAESSIGNDYGLTSMCSALVDMAKPRSTVERIKPIGQMCFQEGHAFDSIIVPISTLRPIGYLQIISEPYNVFKKVEQKLNMPLRIETASGQVGYQSENWQEASSGKHIALIRYVIRTEGKPVLSLIMAKNNSEQIRSFNSYRNLIIIVVSTVTLLAVALFLIIFEKSMLKPLKVLTRHLAQLRENNSFLGKNLALTGSPEIQFLTENFNDLTSKLATLYHRLEDLAFTDQLTALPNRSRLQESLDFYTTLCMNKQTPFALFMMDLDRFKTVNDTLGHQAGDKLLQQVSERLSSVLRKSDHLEWVSERDKTRLHMDFVARLGGDEFAAVLPTVAKSEDAIVVANKILEAMQPAFIIDGFNFSVGISVGIALCPLHGSDAEALMQHADVAMYQAKNNQEGFSVYDSSQDEHSTNLLTLGDDLRKAIKNDQLTLAYQPKIDLHTNQVVGVEVLLRWVHEEHGFISPDEFIPMAEQSGLINEVTHWVLRTALKQKAQWSRDHIDLSVAINLSAKNLLDKSLLTVIKRELEIHQVAPESLYLELTETAVMSDPTHAILSLQQLFDMGIRLSIDDFGTGYSSLSYLKKLPVDEIKIDRSFVMDMEHDANDAVIVQSTIDLAHNMGLSVIAEGVEKEHILAQLRAQGCDLVQGYYISKPLDNNDLIAWLQASDWYPSH